MIERRSRIAISSSYFEQFTWYYAFVLLGIGMFAVTEFFMLPQTTRHFKGDDPSISKPFKSHETVPNSLCLLLSIGLSSVVVLVVCLAQHATSSGELPLPVTSANKLRSSPNTSYRFRQPSATKDYSVHLFHCSILHLWLGVALMAVLTNILKLYIGNLRPDFLSRCRLKSSSESSIDGGWYTISECTNPDLAVVYEGFKSTPSGHSSFISCCMAFLFRWLGRHLPTKRPWLSRGWCLALAAVVMVSRVIDARHHWYDVVFGGAVGVFSHVIASWSVL